MWINAAFRGGDSAGAVGAIAPTVFEESFIAIYHGFWGKFYCKIGFAPTILKKITLLGN